MGSLIHICLFQKLSSFKWRLRGLALGNKFAALWTQPTWGRELNILSADIEDLIRVGYDYRSLSHDIGPCDIRSRAALPTQACRGDDLSIIRAA